MVGHELTNDRDKSQRAVPLASRDTNYRSRNGEVGGQEPSGRPYALPPTRSTTAGIGASRPSRQAKKGDSGREAVPEGHELPAPSNGMGPIGSKKHARFSLRSPTNTYSPHQQGRGRRTSRNSSSGTTPTMPATRASLRQLLCDGLPSMPPGRGYGAGRCACGRGFHKSESPRTAQKARQDDGA